MSKTKAQSLTVGMRIRLEDGSWVRITKLRKTRAFRMSLPGFAERFAVWAEFGQDHVLLHPDAEVEAKAA